MRVSDFSAAVYRRWQGPGIPDATWRPYVISEQVPIGWKWKILLASLYTTFATNEAVFLYAIPPTLLGILQNNSVGPANGSFFGLPNGGLNNEPPLKGAVLLSEGGKNAAFPNEMSSGVGGLVNFSSVNVLNSRRDGRSSFDLPAGWALFGYQSANGGGGSGYNLVLSVMLIPFDACDCADKEPAPKATIPWGGDQTLGNRYAVGMG